jgi:hypothetical protein
MNSLCTVSLSSNVWRMRKIWSVGDLLCWNPHWWSPIISSMYGPNLERRIFDKILYDVDNSDIPWQLLQSVLAPFFMNWYNNRLLPLIRQLFLIPNRITEFMDRRQPLYSRIKYGKLKKYLPQQNWLFLRSVLSQFCSMDVRLGSAQRKFSSVCKPL